MEEIKIGQAFKSACGGFFINIVDIVGSEVIYLFFNRGGYFYPSCRKKPINPNKFVFVSDVQVTKPLNQLEKEVRGGTLILLDQFFGKLPKLKSEYTHLGKVS